MATSLEDLRNYKTEDDAKKEKNKDDVTPELRTKPVATGKKKEATKLPWFLSILLPDESWSVSDLIEYRIKPGIRSGIHSMIVEVIDRWFDDDRSKSRSTAGSYVSYGRYSNRDRYPERSRSLDKREEERSGRRQSAEPAFCEIEFSSKADAVDVLAYLEDTLAEFNILSMADAYTAANMTPQYTDYNYGWKNIDRAYIDRRGGKFYLIMPKAQQIT